ncbi:hypothetical protein E2562_009165 [Oryza meyeriana var. granulata]|uniref:F-box domain-containing protein n=1 Tax=Oryza meyeriana var. granulata TaxID=110450 RepID=A0A6G1CDG1_9ORYZ|nr:hypothetical protein E2562_009165 [Oryza meyeriana var. granulata]
MASSGSSSPSPKRRRVGEAPAAGTDKLLSLPTEILDIILARIPFKHLVRTCCLSRAWRRRWESVPFLDIELSPGSSARVLWRCAAPVHGFRTVADVRRRNIYRAARWLRALARKRVRELTLQFKPSSEISRPNRLLGPALFSCTALVRLHLENCNMPPAPQGFSGFPKLVWLTLDNITLPFKGGGAQLERLIAAATRLAVLELPAVFTSATSDPGDIETWAIRAPNLRELFIIMPSAEDNGCRFAEELPLLEKAYIVIDCLLGTQDFLDAFRRIATVNKLGFVSLYQSNNNLEGITWKFENLRDAHLNTNFGKQSSVLSVVSLLKFAPDIEHLYIMADDTEWLEEDKIDEDSLNTEISGDLFARLKYVSLIGGVKYFSNQMCFMKFLLSKARSLQIFAVTFVYDDERKEWYVKACRELMECQKASPQVVFIPKLSYKPQQTAGL